MNSPAMASRTQWSATIANLVLLPLGQKEEGWLVNGEAMTIQPGHVKFAGHFDV